MEDKFYVRKTQFFYDVDKKGKRKSDKSVTGFVDFTNMVCIQATVESALSNFVGSLKAIKTFYYKTGPRQKAKEIMDDTGGLAAITEYPTEVKAPDGQWTEIENVIKIGVSFRCKCKPK